MTSNTHQIFGRFAGAADPTTASQGESLAVGTYSRKVKGNPRSGRYSFTAIPAGTFTGSLTVWYSSLPNPDPAVAAHWWQDTDLGTLTLTSGTTLGKAVGNAAVTHIRFSVTVATGTAQLSLWVENGE